MPQPGYLKHISVTTVGRIRVVSCLHCGFSVGGLREELLRKIVQQHQCRGERGPDKGGATAEPSRP